MKISNFRILFLLALALVLSLNISAQRRVKPLTFGVSGGAGISNLNDGDGNSADMKFSYQLGMSMDVAFTPNIYLFSGLEFASKGSKIDVEQEGATTKFDISGQYLQVPMYVGCKFDIANAYSRLVFAMGPYFAYGIGGKTTIEDGELSNKINTFDMIKKFDWGIGGRMGMEFGQMHTELVVNLGLVKGFKYAEEKGRMASAYLSFGYNF